MDRGSRHARKDRIAVVEAWQNEWGDQFHCSLGRKILPDRTNPTDLVAAGYRGLTDELPHGQCAVERTPRLLTVRERDCGIVKLKCLGAKEGQVFVLFRGASLLSFQHLFCSVPSIYCCPNSTQMWFSEEWMFSVTALLSTRESSTQMWFKLRRLMMQVRRVEQRMNRKGPRTAPCGTSQKSFQFHRINPKQNEISLDSPFHRPRQLDHSCANGLCVCRRVYMAWMVKFVGMYVSVFKLFVQCSEFNLC